MELRHLRCFIAVAEELHFARAAERLHIEQSPLSRAIKELEYDLGVQLFERSTHLTWAGKVFLEDVRRIFATARVIALACSVPTPGTPALDHGRARTRCSSGIWHAIRESGNRSPHAQKNDLKPWRRVMWCIGALTDEYRARMYALLELYARPKSKAEPVICINEKSLQLIAHSRAPLPMAANSPAKNDYVSRLV